MKKTKNDSQGFTLLELLVVVLIIGILAAIALPQYQMAVGKTKFSTLKENANAIKNSISRYYLIHNNFPNNLEELDIELKGDFSQNKNKIILSDGSWCYITSKDIFCSRKIFGILMEYNVLKNPFNNNKFCVAYSKDLNDKPNRLCQMETAKTQTNAQCPSSGDYCYYKY